MKFLHMSDFHLGKRLNELPLINDQIFMLSQVLGAVEQVKPDAVFISGDIYDKAVPPAEAVQVFDDFLTGLAHRGVQAFIISGNHDSAERLEYGSRLIDNCGIHICSVFDGTLKCIRLNDEHGVLNIHMLPFVKPINVKRFYPEAQINDYTDAVREVIGSAEIDVSERNILLCHQYVTNTTAGHRDEISVGSLDNVDIDVFDNFDYVALGHIHTPSIVGRPQVRYSGSLLEYSFGECGYNTTLIEVEIGAKGTVEIKPIELAPLHRLRKIRGSFEQITSPEFCSEVKTDDYIHATLTDEDDVYDAIGRLRTVYPNLLQLEYDNTRTRSFQSVGEGSAVDEKTPLELFDEFYQKQNNAALSDEQKQYMSGLIDEIWGGNE